MNIKPKTKSSIIAFSLSFLCACGGGISDQRKHEKQRSPADIKINGLNFKTGDLSLRLEYRSHIVNTLENISCDLLFNNKSASLTISQKPDIDLDPFSTEILYFSELKLCDSIDLIKNNSIDYNIRCALKYDKGHEKILENSVIHLVPGSTYQYR